MFISEAATSVDVFAPSSRTRGLCRAVSCCTMCVIRALPSPWRACDNRNVVVAANQCAAEYDVLGCGCSSRGRLQLGPHPFTLRPDVVACKGDWGAATQDVSPLSACACEQVCHACRCLVLIDSLCRVTSISYAAVPSTNVGFKHHRAVHAEPGLCRGVCSLPWRDRPRCCCSYIRE